MSRRRAAATLRAEAQNRVRAVLRNEVERSLSLRQRSGLDDEIAWNALPSQPCAQLRRIARAANLERSAKRRIARRLGRRDRRVARVSAHDVVAPPTILERDIVEDEAILLRA